jgi:hypothetical protein
VAAVEEEVAVIAVVESVAFGVYIKKSKILSALRNF